MRYNTNLFNPTINQNYSSVIVHETVAYMHPISTLLRNGLWPSQLKEVVCPEPWQRCENWRNKLTAPLFRIVNELPISISG